ncbi:hypothetical protein ABEB36_008472 [Hypothenemus hampei]|uniref:Protein phosphatase 1 regulatory subunit 42 n=1 Tax=Hypothenemus hampei TaxID=57062 RepID=A0ABD1ELZ9_HYPHA
MKNITKPPKDVCKKKSISKITHLYLQEKNLKAIPVLSNIQDIEILYLYGNQVSKIEHLDGLLNLRGLYLQNNQIDKIENLSVLRKLKKLYLGKNKISVVEGLDSIDELEELHIEKQSLTDNTPLCFDPRTVFNISESLKVLNIAHNRIPSLACFLPLKNLIVLDASYNDLDDKESVCQILRNWLYLKEAKLIGNPISKRHRYREDIIANTCQLEILDNKRITEVSRRFIKGFEEKKLCCRSKPSINIPNIVEGLPQYHPQSLQQAASTSVIKEMKCKHMDDIAAFNEAEPIYIHWNQLPKRNPLHKTPCALRVAKMDKEKTPISNKKSLNMTDFNVNCMK